jgi:hypothetical protein
VSCTKLNIKDSCGICMTEVSNEQFTVDASRKDIMETRKKLSDNVDKIYSKYYDLVHTVKEDFRAVGRFVTGRGIKNGEILDGLNILFHFLRDKQLAREEDTFQCCRTLHVLTKWLGGENPYPSYLHVPSLDDRFERIYKNNYKFRRLWVALLSEIVEYVQLMHVHDPTPRKFFEETKKLGFDREGFYIHGFDWSKIIGHINMAREKLDKESTPTFRERYAPWDTHRDAFLEDGGGRGVQVSELLAQLKEIGL